MKGRSWIEGKRILDYLYVLLYIPSLYIPSHLQTSSGLEEDLKQYGRSFGGNSKSDKICISIAQDLEGGTGSRSSRLPPLMGIS